MLFEPTPLEGAWVITLDPFCDDRGTFSRVYCRRELSEHGIELDVVQANCGRSNVAGTLRGLHYQPPPHAEPKLIRCSEGAIYDVIVDMRPESVTYLTAFGIELSPQNSKMLFVPQNFAHGYMTLEDNTEIFYMAGEYYVPGLEIGVRYNDPVLNITWPRTVEVISDRDRNWPLLNGGEL
jgi:dTDP-4-dehydrorhamnose 3,5-epimerase